MNFFIDAITVTRVRVLHAQENNNWKNKTQWIHLTFQFKSLKLGKSLKLRTRYWILKKLPCKLFLFQIIFLQVYKILNNENFMFFKLPAAWMRICAYRTGDKRLTNKLLLTPSGMACNKILNKTFFSAL